MGLPHKEKSADEIDHSDFGSERNESCCSRICSPKGSLLRDVMRGLLVIVVLAVVSVIIFLLCYFLIHDLENKEETLVEDLVDIFSEEESIPQPDYSIANQNAKNYVEYNEHSEQKGRIKEEISSTDSNRDVSIFVPESHVPTENIKDHVSYSTSERYDPVVIKSKESVSPTEPSPEEDYEDIFDYEVVKTSSFAPESSNKCVPLDKPLCSSSMPWVVGVLPNWINDTTIPELKESSSYFQAMLIDSQCSVWAKQYICSILEPPCGPDSVPLPPCRAFCEDVLQSCGDVIKSSGIKMDAFNCVQFPSSSNPNVCVDINRVTSTQSTTTERRTEPTTYTSGRSNPFAIEEQPVTDTVDSNDEYDEPMICDHSKFLCEDGSDCLLNTSVCDGVQHCLDNSDEKGCKKPGPLFTNSRRPTLSEMLLGSRVVSAPLHEPVSSASNSEVTFQKPSDQMPPRKSLATRISATIQPKRQEPSQQSLRPNQSQNSPRSLSEILAARREAILRGR